VTTETPPFDQIGIVVGLASEAKLARKLTANVLCSGGRPEVASRQALELVNNGVTTLMSFGIAGALSPKLRPGSRVVATEIVTDFDSYPAISTSAKLLKGHSGAIYGGWEIVATPEDKAALYARTGALAVDMESAPVAKVAMDRGVPFIALRVVADPANSGLPPAALLPLSPTGRPRLLAVFWSVLTRPGQIPALIRTANQTRAAMKSLRRAVRRLSG
jgi:hopanoid-associated phosphorylase